MKTFVVDQMNVADVQNLLQNTVAPRPIAFASTIDRDGKANLSPFSFFNVFSSNPPILIFSPARRGADGTLKDTYLNIKEVPEVVINMVSFDMVEQMSLASVEYEKGVSEFDKAGFSKLKSETVKPYRVAEAPVQFECVVKQVIELGDQPGAGNLMICEVKRVHVQEAVLDANGQIDTLKLDLVARMGGPNYVKTIPEALFQIPKPVSVKAMGMDALPYHIRASKYLTGSELARLAGLENLPEPTGKFPQKDDFDKARTLIQEGKIAEAFSLLY